MYRSISPRMRGSIWLSSDGTIGVEAKRSSMYFQLARYSAHRLMRNDSELRTSETMIRLRATGCFIHPDDDLKE